MMIVTINNYYIMQILGEAQSAFYNILYSMRGNKKNYKISNGKERIIAQHSKTHDSTIRNVKYATLCRQTCRDQEHQAERHLLTENLMKGKGFQLRFQSRKSNLYFECVVELVWPLLPLLRQSWCGLLLSRCHLCTVLLPGTSNWSSRLTSDRSC